MIIKKGNMWDEVGLCDLILFTANSSVRNGKMVMGGGAAKEAKNLFKTSEWVFGKWLEDNNKVDKFFGIIIPQSKATEMKGTTLGAFQTKREVWKDSDLELVEKAIKALNKVADQYERVVLNYPAIGLGNLKEEDVLPLLEVLPDNVIIYKFEE